MNHKAITLGVVLLLAFAATASPKPGESLSWSACVKEAIAKNPDLVSAREKLNQAIAGAAGINSLLYPAFNATLSGSASGLQDNASGSSSFGLSGRYTVFDGYSAENQIKQSAEKHKAADLAYKFSGITVRFNLKSAFTGLLKAQELIKLTEEIVTLRKQDLELIKLSYKTGMEHKGSLLTAEANLAQAELEARNAKRGLETSRQELRKMLGRTDGNEVNVESVFKQTVSAKEGYDLKNLLEKIPAVLQLAENTKAAEFGVRIASADTYPTLSINGSYSKAVLGQYLKGEDLSAGITLSYPLFDGGLTLSRIASAEAVLRQTKADEESGRNQALLSLNNALAVFMNAEEALTVQKKFMDASEERAKIAQAEYSMGLITFDNWTIIKDDLVRQKKAYLDAEAGLLAAEAAWFQAIGGGLNDEK